MSDSLIQFALIASGASFAGPFDAYDNFHGVSLPLASKLSAVRLLPAQLENQRGVVPPNPNELRACPLSLRPRSARSPDHISDRVELIDRRRQNWIASVSTLMPASSPPAPPKDALSWISSSSLAASSGRSPNRRFIAVVSITSPIVEVPARSRS